MRQTRSLITYFIIANTTLGIVVYALLSIAIYYLSGPMYLHKFWFKNDIWMYFAIIWIPVLIVMVNLLLIHNKILHYIEVITDLNQRTEEGDFSLFPESCIPNDEVGELLHVRNQMLHQLMRSKNTIESELKGARERLKRTSQLSSLGEMTIAIAHELEDPISSLSNNIDNLDLALASPNEKRLETANEALNSSKAIIKKMKKLIKQLHAFNAPKEFWENRDLNDLTRNLLELIGKQFNLTGIEVNAGINAPQSICYVEPSLFKHVLICLISNALEAMRESKVKKIEVKTSFDKNTNLFQIMVADTGPGISTENQQKIFSPFFTTKSSDEPTGLGLSAALDIIKRHKGTLELESVEGLGTKFIIKLPLSIKK